MDKSHRIALLAALGVTSGAITCYTFYKLMKSYRDISVQRFPRAQDIERERASRFKNMKVDMEHVHLVCSADEWEAVYPHILEDLAVYKAVGLDCEWTNIAGQVGPVSLLQLATTHGLCVLVRLNQFVSFPESLASFLSNRGILKIGVACYDDAQKMLHDHKLCVRGCVDLRYVTARSKTFKTGNMGLKALTETVLGLTLDKRLSVRCSDWDTELLSTDQIKYAAADALAGINIFNKLLEYCQTGSQHLKHKSETEIWRLALSACQGIVDVKYSNKGQTTKTVKTRSPHVNNKEKNTLRGYSCRQRPLYHNCQLMAPDGQLLCTCDTKKALWYIDKGLGKKVFDSPLTIQLKFEPSGRPASEANYYLNEKENICIVCGRDNSFNKKYIIPKEYRKHFPSVMKDHKSHDVLLMCSSCHQKSSLQDDVLKVQLAEKCDAPLGSGTGAKYFEDKTIAMVRSAARALMLSAKSLPMARKTELQKVVMDFYGASELDDNLLRETMNLDTRVESETYQPHGKKVVVHMMNEGGLITFEKLWRQHFLDTMKPQFLPKMWSVDHSHERLALMEAKLNNAVFLVDREKQFFE